MNYWYVDFFLVHNPLEHVRRLKEVWKAMIDVKKKGLTTGRSISVSNFHVTMFEEVMAMADGSEVPVVNQAWCNIQGSSESVAANRHRSG